MGANSIAVLHAREMVHRRTAHLDHGSTNLEARDKMRIFAVRRKLSLLLSILLLLASASVFFATRYSMKLHTSPNWAGYVMQGTDGVTMVSAKWTVPALDCQKTPNAYSTAWVGVGGLGHAAVWPFPQTGSDSNCVDGEQVDDYWCSYQTFKQYVVSPGDVIEAKVFRNNKEWFCSVNDVTVGKSNTKVLDYKYTGITSTSEWIVESTTISKGNRSKIGTLADFEKLTFGRMSISPGRLGTVGHQSQDNVSMTGPNGKVIAFPSWSAGVMTIIYK